MDKTIDYSLNNLPNGASAEITALRGFSGKTALVTGAASGMGLLFCQCFVKAGGNAVLVDINEEQLSCCADQINTAYPDETGQTVLFYAAKGI